MDFWSFCGKDNVWAHGLSITGLRVDLCLWEVEAHTRKSHICCGLQYAFMPYVWCRNKVYDFYPILCYYIRHRLVMSVESGYQDGLVLHEFCIVRSFGWVKNIISVHSSVLDV